MKLDRYMQLVFKPQLWRM